MDNNFLINEDEFKNHILNSRSSPYGTRSTSNVEERVVFQTHRVCVSKPVDKNIFKNSDIHPGHGDQDQKSKCWSGSGSAGAGAGGGGNGGVNVKGCKGFSSVVNPQSLPQNDFLPQQNIYRPILSQRNTLGKCNRNVIQFDTSMTPDDLRQKLVEIAEERDKLQEDLKNYSAENANLRQQLSSRRRIQSNYSYSPQRQQRQSESENIFGTSTALTPLCHLHNTERKETSEEDEEDYNDCCSDEDEITFLLPDDLRGEAHNQSRISVILSQSMTVLANINNQQVIEKVCAGSQIAKQLLVGNFAGYFASYLVRRFGKVAAGSIIGSVCLLKLAHHRGYIAVDWSRIQKQIDGTGAGAGTITGKSEDVGIDIGDDIAWVTTKIQQIRHWSHDNTYTVLGFCTGFFFYNFHR